MEKLVRGFDSIQKYLNYKNDVYVPIIYKHENEFCDNSIWIMYVRQGVSGFSRRKVLFHVKAGTLEAGLGMFLALYNEKCVARIIQGRDWFGNAPYEVDFSND